MTDYRDKDVSIAAVASSHESIGVWLLTLLAGLLTGCGLFGGLLIAHKILEWAGVIW